MKKILPLLIAALLQFPLGADAQGLTGPVENQRWGSSTCGELLPGKTDSERWKLFQSNEKTLLGKSEREVIKLFGKGGSGFKTNQRVYRITDWKRKSGKPVGTVTDVSVNFVDGKVESFEVHLVHCGNQ